jgi:3-oxoacyl-[acyl-carrier protein] reductase
MGIVGLTKTIAKEWGGFNIRCNAIVYGTIKTRLVGAKESGAAMSIGGEQVNTRCLVFRLSACMCTA